MIGDDGRLKVLDFGLAKVRNTTMGADADPEADTQMPTVTQEGTIMGTVSYMSPEQSEGRAIDPRSDIFSLGVIFYEMASGQRPFRGETSMSIISAILKDNPTPLSELREDLPGRLSQLVSECLQKGLDDRIQSTRELREQLQKIQIEASSPSIQASMAGTRGTGIKKPVVIGGIAAAVAVLAVAGIMIFGGGDDRVETPEPKQQPAAVASSPGESIESDVLDRAEAFAELGMVGEAMTAYRALLTNEDERIVSRARSRLTDLELTARPEFERLKENGRSYYNRGETQASVDALERALNLFPEDGFTNYMAARSMMANGESQSAIDAMEVAAKSEGVSPDWFGDQEFYPLYRDPRWVELVASVAGDDTTAQFMNLAEAARKAELEDEETDLAQSGDFQANVDDDFEDDFEAPAAERSPTRTSPEYERASATTPDVPAPTRPTPAPLPRSNEPRVLRLEIDENGLVTDPETRLMWGSPNEATAWKDAENYAKGFGKGGFVDWRMPTLNELRDICEAVNVDDGPERLPRFIWSSDRRGPPIPRARKAGLADRRDNGVEGFYTVNEIKDLLDQRRGMNIYAIAIRDAN